MSHNLWCEQEDDILSHGYFMECPAKRIQELLSANGYYRTHYAITRRIARRGMHRPGSPIIDRWTSKHEAFLRQNLSTMTTCDISRNIGISQWRISRKITALGLKKVPIGKKLSPPREEWSRIASEEAISAGCSPCDVLSGRKDRKHVIPRWRALERLRAEYPKASIAGIGRITGFDRTAISHAFKRLDAMSNSR